MWFATQDGLNRYDGYSFVHYEHDDGDSTSLSDNYVNVVFMDHTGTLWTGTRGGGVDRFVPATGSFVRYRHSSTSENTISDDEVRCICEDRDGTLWVGTSGGLDRYDRAADRFIRCSHNPRDAASIPPGLVECLFEDAIGNLWIGMLGSLEIFEKSTGKFSPVALPVPGTLCVWISEDDGGHIWIAMQNQFYIYKDGKWSPASTKIKGDTIQIINRILKDRDGVMWYGGNGGLLRYNKHRNKLDRFTNISNDPLSLSGNSILSLYQDREGILWVGTYDGVNKYAPAEFKFRHVKLSPDVAKPEGWNKIRSFCEDPYGRIWVATQQGLMTYDRKKDVLARVANNSWYQSATTPRLIWSLLEDETYKLPTIWVGTNGDGLIRMTVGKSGSEGFTRFIPRRGDNHSISSPSPETLYETRDGTLWIGTLWEGLNRFDKKTGTFTRYVNSPSDPESLSGNEVWSLYQDSSGSLWVGTGGDGLDKLDIPNGRFTRFRHDPRDPSSLSDDKVTAIVEGRNSSLWIGTYSGLNEFDTRSGKFRHYTVRDGLPNNVVYGIADDHEGDLWISTNSGLSRFSISDHTFRNYDAGDGLQSNEFNHGAEYLTRERELLFGGVNGFSIFYPDSLPENKNIPDVVITDFKIFNKSVRPGNGPLTSDISAASEVRLSYNDAVISFDFAALEYTNPEKNRYAYKMDGFDKDWVYAGSRREATYTNLDPGKYVFEVKAANSDGLWGTTPKSISILISPPFWATWWFRSGVALMFLSFGPLVYLKRVSALKKKQNLQQEFSRRLIESQEAERKRVAAELHDSIGQDLLVIKNKLLLGLQSGNSADGGSRDFEEVVEHVTGSIKHVREISRNLRPIQLDQIGLTSALESVVEVAAESSQIQPTLQIDNIDNLLSKESEINFFRIVQESLNNIIKHSQASELSVIIIKSDRMLTLEIKDNGRGMDLREAGRSRNKGLGLTGMVERSRILGGELRLESSPGKGAKVTLKVPLGAKDSG